MDSMDPVSPTPTCDLAAAGDANASGQIRPSYMEPIDDHTGGPKDDFNEEVVKNLSADLKEGVENENIEAIEGGVIKTYLRIRPHPAAKASKGDHEHGKLYEIECPTALLVKQDSMSKRPRSGETKFIFSGIFDAEKTQASVFEDAVLPLVDKFLEGENCLVFSYGATNSGKTYTMQGYGTNFGVIPRTLEYCFQRLGESVYTRGDVKPNRFEGHVSLVGDDFKRLEEAKRKLLRDSKTKKHEIDAFIQSCRSERNYPVANGNVQRSFLAGQNVGAGDACPAAFGPAPLYSIWVSFAEIYNDRVYDLFEVVEKGAKRKELKLFQDSEGRVYIHDLTEFTVKTAEEAYRLFLVGREMLQFAETNMNYNSSRSHSFFSVRVICLGWKNGFAYPLKVYRLAFCDLAGVERVSQTGNVGLRLKESGTINNSLLVLLRCIRALRDRQEGKSVSVVPFRESKLSRLFKSFLTAALHIRMLVTINPDPATADSTFQVLMNAAVASQVQLPKKVEAPVYNSNFCRRLRVSMGLPPPFKAYSPSTDDEESYLSTTEEDTIEIVDNNPTVRRTTVSGAVVMPVQQFPTRLDILEEENRKLREEIRTIQDKVQDQLHEKFVAIYQQQEEFYKNLIKENTKDTDELHRQRLSLARHYFREYPEAILNVSGSEFEAIVTKIPKTATRNEQDDFRASHEAKVKASTEAQALDESFLTAGGSVEELDVKVENEDTKHEALLAEIHALQEQLEESQMTIQDLRKELLDVVEERRIDEQKTKNIEQVLQLLREETEKMELEHKTKRYSLLAVELEKERETIEAKEKELADATKLCQGYHVALEEANAMASAAHAKNAELELQILKMKEEDEFLHLTVDDLEEKIIRLKSQLGRYQKESDSDSNMSCPFRPRRAGASYRAPSATSVSPRTSGTGGASATVKYRRYKTKSKSTSSKRGSAHPVPSSGDADGGSSDESTSEIRKKDSTSRKTKLDEYEPLSPLMEQDFSQPSKGRVRKA